MSDPKNVNFSRRDLLRGTAGVVAGVALTGSAAAAPQYSKRRKKSERLRFGIIACGGKGWSGMMAAAAHGDIVAVCDIDVTARTKAMMEFPRATAFEDYREMIDAMKNDLDAVVVSTPDHHHAPASALSMKAGLHCYCEKPLARTIWEVRELSKIAKSKRVATQMGNQSTASTPMRKVAKLIRDGHFGQVKEVYLWTDRAGGWWKQGHRRPAPTEVPKIINWETWVGPRPERPYAEGYHPFAWRGFWDFGTGSLGDMGCHIFNMPFMALGLRDPISVQAKTSGHNRDSFPAWVNVTYEFGARGDRGPLTLNWYDGGQKPPTSLAPGVEYQGNGVLVVTEKGTIYSPNEFNAEFKMLDGSEMPDVEVVESPGHMAEFAAACQGGPPAVSNMPNYSGPLTELVLLGNLAIWADGPRLEWDAKNMKVKGSTEYDSLIHPEFRPDWALV